MTNLTADQAPVHNKAPAVPVESGQLRVLLVTARYFPYAGGVETHTYEVARRLAAKGLEITVLTTDPSRQLKPAEQLEGVQILRVKAWPSKGDYYFAPGIYRIITQGKWDIVHCQGYNTLVAPLAMLAALRSKRLLVVTFHSGGHSSRLRNLIRGTQQILLRPLLSRAKRLIAVSNFEAKYFSKRLRLPAAQFVVIPNGSDLPKLTSQPSSQSDGLLIISVGRLERYKGHHRVIAAMPKVLEQYPDARLQIIGAGPYEGELRRLAAQLGISERVQIGSISGANREGMAQALSRATLVTLLSDYESHGIAAIEALALGRPVLVTNTSGLGELAEHGLARAIPLNSSTDTIAAAIQHEIRQPLTPPRFDLPTWDGCATELLAIYRSILARRQSVP